MAEPVQPDKEQKRLIRMAETISKALPYMRRHNDATFVVKYGGHAMTDPKLGDLVAAFAVEAFPAGEFAADLAALVAFAAAITIEE